MDTTKTITHVSLCAGYGGIDLGLRRAISGLRTIAVSEIEAYAVANLVAKMEAEQLDPAPIWTDVKTFPWAQLQGCVDVLSGGYPCQPFSAAGKRLGKADHRHLWPWIADGIDAMQPGCCFFENVEGHVSLGLREVLGDLESLGYTATWGLFSAAEVGAPHQRKRVFILAHRHGSGGWQDRLSAQLRPEGSQQPSGDRWTDATGAAEQVWPSRPSEPQHAWEPSRVVADAQRTQRRQGAVAGIAGLGEENSDRAGECGELADAGSPQQHGLSQPEGRYSSIEAGQPSDGAAVADATSGARLGEAQRPSGHLAFRDEVGEPRQTQPAVGGMPHGGTSRVDELRLLGNGVVPATAERAFRTLYSRLTKLTN